MKRLLKLAIPTGILGYAAYKINQPVCAEKKREGILCSSTIPKSFKLNTKDGKYDISIAYDNVNQIHVDYRLKEEPIIQDLNGEYQIAINGKHTWFHRSKGTINIVLPTDIEKVKVDFVGKLNFQGNTGKSKNIEIKSVGKIEVEDLKAENIKFNNASGTITADNIVAKTVDINSASGSIRTQNINADRLYINSAAGKIDSKFNSIGDYCEFKTAAGSIKAEVEFKNSGKFVSDTSAGSTEASVRNYSEAELNSSVGSIVADLVPNQKSKTTLNASVASIKATIKGFKGSLITSSSAGKVKLLKNGEKVDYVQGGDSTLIAKASVGEIKINFIE